MLSVFLICKLRTNRRKTGNTHKKKNENKNESVQNVINMEEGNNLVRLHLCPPMTFELHKGQAGRIGVIGGSPEYCGAPYFAAMTAMKMGADLAYVVCETSAAPVIKSYSPELIVYPYLFTEANRQDRDGEFDLILGPILALLPRLHALVIGPGLGRESCTLECVEDVIKEACENKLPLVLDGDGLFLISQKPHLVQGRENVILTPNVVEFQRLCEKMNIDSNAAGEGPATALATALGHVTVVRKGHKDVITDGRNVLVCTAEGSPRRCGGQGDILAGATGTFLAWALKHPLIKLPSKVKPSLLACYAACWLTREAARLAFLRCGRSTTSTDLLADIPRAFTSIMQSSTSSL